MVEQNNVIQAKKLDWTQFTSNTLGSNFELGKKKKKNRKHFSWSLLRDHEQVFYSELSFFFFFLQKFPKVKIYAVSRDDSYG